VAEVGYLQIIAVFGGSNDQPQSAEAARTNNVDIVSTERSVHGLIATNKQRNQYIPTADGWHQPFGSNHNG
jgi:hypothetical protein